MGRKRPLVTEILLLRAHQILHPEISPTKFHMQAFHVKLYSLSQQNICRWHWIFRDSQLNQIIINENYHLSLQLD